MADPFNSFREDDPFAGLTDDERAEIERAGTVTEEDVDDAMRQWRQDAPPAMRDTLDAMPEVTSDD